MAIQAMCCFYVQYIVYTQCTGSRYPEFYILKKPWHINLGYCCHVHVYIKLSVYNSYLSLLLYLRLCNSATYIHTFYLHITRVMMDNLNSQASSSNRTKPDVCMLCPLTEIQSTPKLTCQHHISLMKASIFQSTPTLTTFLRTICFFSSQRLCY